LYVESVEPVGREITPFNWYVLPSGLLLFCGATHLLNLMDERVRTLTDLRKLCVPSKKWGERPQWWSIRTRSATIEIFGPVNDKRTDQTGGCCTDYGPGVFVLEQEA